MLWQSAYAELIFLDTLWPDFDRRHLWYACELYAQRDRRFGGAIPNPVPVADRHLTREECHERSEPARPGRGPEPHGGRAVPRQRRAGERTG